MSGHEANVVAAAQAAPTDKQSLVEITDQDAGEPINLDQFIRREVRLVIQDRNTMRARYRSDPQKPWLVCAFCGAAVQLVSHTDRTFYFRHMPEEEDRGCPVNTKGKYSPDEINAMKYNGVKESHAHQQLKILLRDSIAADSRFNPPGVERVWRGMDRKSWRKPDVQAVWGERRFAFEIQLSTTFLSVIVDRREFYRAENGHLLWVFKSFDPHRTRRAEEDIFFNNNSNVFVVSHGTYARSREAGRLALECWYAVPTLVGGIVVDAWHSADIYVDDLLFDTERQRAYYFDYDSARHEVECQLADARLAPLRDAFETFWKKYCGNYSREGAREWGELRAMFAASSVGFELPETYDGRPFAGVISMMLSAKHGEPFGYRNQKLIDVTNTAFNSYKPYLYLFGWALKIYGHEQQLAAEDTKGTWAARRTIIRQAMETGDPEYQRKTNYDYLVLFLLPELRVKLKG